MSRGWLCGIGGIRQRVRVGKHELILLEQALPENRLIVGLRGRYDLYTLPCDHGNYAEQKRAGSRRHPGR